MNTNKKNEELLTWYKTETVKDETKVNKAKIDFINEIKKVPVSKINNTDIVEKKYTLWERIRRVLGMS
jgi:hypothetical protein